MNEIFPFGRPVMGRNLVGREKELQDIISFIENNQSVILIGPRRYGKTSIILEVLQRLQKNGWYIGNVDFFDVSTKNRLAEKIIRTTLKNRIVSTDGIIDAAKRGFKVLKDSIELKQIINEGIEIILTFSDSKTDVDVLLEESLDFPEKFAEKHKTRIFFAYDELGDITRINGDLIKKMRAKFQLHKRAIYMFTGSQESIMNDIFVEKKGPFYGFCHVIELGPVPEKAFKKYIHGTFKKVKVKISDSALDKILSLTSCHPYYTQYLCQVLYLNKRNMKKVTEDDINECFEQMIDLQQTYLDSIWVSLKHESVLQLKICLFLSKHPDKSVYSEFDDNRQNIYSALRSLINKGIVRRKEKRYELVDPLFKKYLERIPR